jgi:DNA-binding MarR family transcriptional regulator
LLKQRPHPDGTDLTVAQWRALIVIGEHPASAVNAIGKSLGVGLPAASILIDRLVRSGLVNRHRSSTDRRLALCSLTESGNALYQTATQGERQLHDWLAQMSAEDLEALSRGLTALSDIAHRPTPILEGNESWRNP